MSVSMIAMLCLVVIAVCSVAGLGLRRHMSRWFQKENARDTRGKIKAAYDRYHNGTVSGLMVWWAIAGFFFGALLGAVGALTTGQFPEIMFYSGLIGIGFGVGSPIYVLLAELNKGRKGAKAVKNTINQTLSHSGTPFEARARQEIAKEEAKAAQKEIIKGAVIGSVIAGGEGAVVGAMAAKAKQDAENGGKAK